MDTQLERLKRISDLRTIWKNEEGDFTPWLARNLELLGKTLGVELELEAMEKTVGPFRADILCRETGPDGGMVLVENQLEPTDHTHLGQLLTYAAGLDAVTIVWIAAAIRDEHRATLDWLNKITDESSHFFGLEIELWCIGDSAPAPRFNIVSKPNDWSRSVTQAARAVNEEDLSEMQRTQVAYWIAFNDVLNKTDGPFSGTRKPNPYNWMGYGVGRSGFSLAAGTNARESQIRVQLSLSGLTAKGFFGLLEQQKNEIEEELEPLEWHELPGGKESKICCVEPADPTDRSDWSRQHEWLAERLNRMHEVFSPRVKELDINDWVPGNA